MYFVGIDPGADGAVVIISETNLLYAQRISQDDDHCSKICKIFRLYSPTELVVAIEDLRAIYGVRSDSTFALGWACGFWNGVCDAYGLQLHPVKPKEWQAAMVQSPRRPVVPKGLHITERRKIMYRHKQAIKAASVDAARAIYPEANIIHDGVADAVCIANWLKHKYKNEVTFL